MNSRARWLVLSLLFSLLPVHVAHAQERGWSLSAASEAGAFYPTRDLAKNVGGVQEIIALQVSSKMDPAATLGVALEAIRPDNRMIVRAGVRTTLGGKASARIALCSVLEGELCAARQADARLTSFHGEMIFVQGRPQDRLRQNFIVGLGVRSYTFQVEACDPDANPNPDFFVICELVQDIYEEQARIQGFLEFGFGFSTEVGPWSLFGRIVNQVGPYQGGAGNAEGNFQADLYFLGGVSVRVH